MSAFVHGLVGPYAPRARRRRRLDWARPLAALAAGVGHVLRAVRVAAVHAPGVAAPVVMAYGLWMLAPWLGVVAAGVFLLLLDRRSAGS